MSDNPVAKVRCPECDSRLEVSETPSGSRTVSVAGLGPSVEQHAKALERFLGPEAGPDIICPACSTSIDPAAPYRAKLRPLSGPRR